MSWNKYNLWNLSRFSAHINHQSATFFQQKWAAKGMARAYHGEHIPEKVWERLFSRRLRSVVEMPPKYLAAYDGSEQAAGRGSGRHHDPKDPRAGTPVVSNIFSVTERQRLSGATKSTSIGVPARGRN